VPNKLVILSGGFDPLHIGHVAMIKDSAEVGDVVVCLNSDDWLARKKGKPFMNWDERATIVFNIKNVIDVMHMDDSDGTACDGIRKVFEKYRDEYDQIFFGNGGDRNTGTTPSAEQITSEELGIGLLWELGGSNKPQSSSWILEKWKEPITVQKPWGHFKTFRTGEHYKIKELVISPKKRISLQYHEHRSELWMVVQGTISATIGGMNYTMSEGRTIYVGKESVHRIYNPSKTTDAIVAEIQYGDKVDEDDIVRLEDDFNR